eukprot:gene3765-4341_t
MNTLVKHKRLKIKRRIDEDKVNQSELKRAYYRLAKEVHPDKNNSAEAKEQFQKLGRIYAILKDPKTREFYDQHGDTDSTGLGTFSGKDLYEAWLQQYNIVRLTEERISDYFKSLETERKTYGLAVSNDEENDLIEFYNKKKGNVKLIKEEQKDTKLSSVLPNSYIII